MDIGSLRQEATASDQHCNIENFDIGDSPSTQLVGIRLTSRRMQTLTRLKISFETILKGDRLSKLGEPIWEPFFFRKEGQTFVGQLLSRFEDTRIEVNDLRRHITLYGSPGKRRALRTAMLTKFDQLMSLRTHAIPLDGKLIGIFMSMDLRKLQDELGMENVSLDLSNRVLRVRGNQEAYRSAQVAIHRAKYRHPDERSPEHGSCPVCLDDVTNPILLECGHSWCKSCLANFLRSSIDNKVFPISCLGDEARCAKPISLRVARDVLSPAEFEAVVRASFTAHVHTHPSEFYYCPTPDCPQVYRKAPRDTVLQCPSCLTRICPNCHVTYHQGRFCPDPNTEDTKLFDEWTKKHDVKQCPGCKAPIERAEGCNHVNCARCKAHICWVCLKTFAESKSVYDHMFAQHGGIGL
ncbi:hypothetical protein NLI96_g6729 [Meripilus lineatus]|uniref:RING-type domain-containing protein n=1 Tax=Meripilus lineatus TaxID=2056292 RepID=A0AAD5V0D3_9APHY|nr:hypothetical protein NLI96_g6729 [Physisporinus lineatus]